MSNPFIQSTWLKKGGKSLLNDLSVIGVRIWADTLIVYRKGEYAIEIDYSGERANYEWQYGISVKWGGKE
jgi:hypothetical protein